MRMRKKKNRDQRFLNCISLAEVNPENNKGKWNLVFENQNPIHLEIGCGKGGFVTECAKQNPDINFVALEKCLDVIILAMEKVKENGLTNVRFILSDAEKLTDIFEEDEVSVIYLNFSDPWKKSKQAKRRLTYRTFLKIYEQILKPEGEVRFKTDNRPLFNFSLEEFENYGANVSNVTFDLHNSVYNDSNIQTEYEKNFSAQGFTINRCVVKFTNIRKK